MNTQPEKLDEELVEVFDTQVESEAQVIIGLLESAGIEAMMTGLDAPQEVLPGVGGVIVRVSADRAEEALRIIEEQRADGPGLADAAEEPSGSGPQG